MPKEKRVRIGDHYIIDRLNARSVVIDMGAHVGTFSRSIMDKYGCVVVAFEPNAYSFSELAKLHIKYRNLICYRYAIHPENKETEYTDYGNDGYSGSLYERSGKMYSAGRKQLVCVIPFERAIGERERIDLVKMDIEGSEVPVLMSTPMEALVKCEQIAVEFHIGKHKGFNPAFTMDDVNKCVTRLTKMGFKADKTNSRNPDYLFFKP